MCRFDSELGYLQTLFRETNPSNRWLCTAARVTAVTSWPAARNRAIS